MEDIPEDKEDAQEDKEDVQEDPPAQAEEIPEPPPPPPKAPVRKPRAKVKVKEPEPEPEPKKKAQPKKYEKATCQDCGKTMSLNQLRYKHRCSSSPAEEEQPTSRSQPAYEPSSPKTRLRDLYAEARQQQFESKRAKYRSFFDSF